MKHVITSKINLKVYCHCGTQLDHYELAVDHPDILMITIPRCSRCREADYGEGVEEGERRATTEAADNHHRHVQALYDWECKQDQAYKDLKNDPPTDEERVVFRDGEPRPAPPAGLTTHIDSTEVE